MIKRLSVQVNRRESMNVQTDHFAKVVCSFVTAATPVNVVKTFRRAGICLILDDGVLRYWIHPHRAQCLLVPIVTALPPTPDKDEDEDDMKADLLNFAQTTSPMGRIPDWKDPRATNYPQSSGMSRSASDCFETFFLAPRCLIAVQDQIAIVVLKKFSQPSQPRVGLFRTGCGACV
jgi:hypothetical protein